MLTRDKKILMMPKQVHDTQTSSCDVDLGNHYQADIFCTGNNKKQEGWLSPKERASVSAISLIRHILASHGYTPGTIEVNVTRMKSGFNACQRHRNMYPSIF